MEPVYRPNVAAILRRKDGKILLGERLGVKDCWQFPQGGIDPGEEPLAAALRELEEEMGIPARLVEFVECRDGYRYLFPDGRTKYGIYAGQEQTYFLFNFHGQDGDIHLDTGHPEFQRFRWIKPSKYKLRWIPRFKRGVYRQVLANFFGEDQEAVETGVDGFGSAANESE